MALLTGPALVLIVAFSSCVKAVILNETSGIIRPCYKDEFETGDPKPHQVSLSGCQQSKECKLDHEYPYKLEFTFTPDKNALPDQVAILQASNANGTWQQSMLVSGIQFNKTSTQVMYLQLAHLNNETKELHISVTQGEPDTTTGLPKFNFCFQIKVSIFSKANIAYFRNDVWKTGETCVAKGFPCNFKHSFCEQVGDEHLCKCNPNMVEHEGRCLVKPGEFCFSSQECVENANCDYKNLTCACVAETTLDEITGTCNGCAEHKGSFVLAVLMAFGALAKFMF